MDAAGVNGQQDFYRIRCLSKAKTGALDSHDLRDPNAAGSDRKA
jgi:hypothetical protein